VNKNDSMWNKKALGKMHNAIEDSTVFMSIFTESYKSDPTALVQMVFAMMLDKPIYLLVQEGTKIPAAFRKIASGIETFKDETDLHEKTKKLLKDTVNT
jgi:hypothetical protein